MRSNEEERFVAWLTKQRNANGAPYLLHVARQYASNLRCVPSKLNLPVTHNDEEYNVFSCRILAEFERLRAIFLAAPNFQEVNRNSGHGSFSAGLSAYRRYLESHEKSKSEEGAEAVYYINEKSSVFAQQHIRTAFRDWLIQKNPSWGNSTLNMLCSDALYLYNNERGITLTSALIDADGLEKAYDVLEQHFTAFPRQTGTAATAAKGYTDTLKLFREFLTEKFPELLHGVGSPVLTVPQEILDVLSAEYTNGFRFDSTALRLLSNKSGIELDDALQVVLRRQMFSRGDDIYFLLDSIADEITRNDIINIADQFLDEYGCFEISELYTLYEYRLNHNIICNTVDFERFYEFINTRNIRCVAAPYIGNRVARFSNGNVWNTFNEIAAKIVAVTHDEYGGTISEDDLHSRFCAFSVDLLTKIIKNAAGELVRTEINGIIIYQTLDALGLTDNFSDILHSTLERLDDLGIAPSVEALHTALSLKIGVNFNIEYNIPDKSTYQRLITANYKAKPPREWKCGIFTEVSS